MTTKPPKLIVVVGASGRQGGSVIKSLLEVPDRWLIRGVTGDLNLPLSQEFAQLGINMIQCDINNREECCRAFADAYGVFAVTNSWDAGEKGEYEQAVNLVEAARKMNVKHFILSLFPETEIVERIQYDVPTHPLNESQIERYIRQLPSTSTFAYTTLIRIGYYYQNLMTFFVPNSTNIEFRYPLFSPRRIPLYDVRDTGKIVSECFRQPERWSNGPVIPVVAEHLTMEDICTKIQEMARKEVKFVPLPYDEAIRKLHREMVITMRWYSEIGSIDEQQAEKTKEIYPNMRKFTDWIQETNRLLE